MKPFVPARRRSANAWGVTPDDPAGDSTRFVDFVAFFVLGFPTVVVPRIGVPLNELGPALLVLVTLARPARPGRFHLWWVLGVGAIVGWLAVTSYVHDLTPYRRMLHMGLFAALALVMASGRVHMPSAARGLSVGLVGSTVASIAGVGPDLYAGRLSGLLGDPNLAGYLLTVLGCVAIGALPPGRWRKVVMAVVAVGVVLTLSRTALLAALFAIIWVLVHRRIGLVRSAALVAGFIWVVASIPPDLRLLGPFADRRGSDELRQRLVERERIDVEASPIIGSGAGTGQVRLGDDTFFYHSSYLAIQREGGLVLLVIFLLVVTGVFLSLLRMPSERRNGWYEAAFICLLVIALNLGEVLLELPAAVALGFGAWHAFRAPPDPPDAPDPPVAVSGQRPGRRAGVVS